MIRKLSFLTGLATGYVLGAKAGQERYQQIVDKARELAGMPAVQEATTTLSAAATTAADKAKAKVDEVVDLNGSSSSAQRPVAGATASGSAPDVAAR